eukprot:CAMPEP_0202445466 /NCGR_PEP_ID=MMETSP1360-20130828/4290_1 /ASSEMBLY_ACC=CAM_ASM_000848 /TAXON_ID=515479 /ORGANISM="Licmophora paradoxa, Strain CCMP2313" /LENGTH=425 /DNA_ID=CAMNT_0049061753 /DNA_START=72 /DNA_END=1349 /DNA_ORIENTATION=+
MDYYNPHSTGSYSPNTNNQQHPNNNYNHHHNATSTSASSSVSSSSATPNNTNTTTTTTTSAAATATSIASAVVASAEQEKINRELFVGNTPPGTTELLLRQFLNAAMRRIHLCGTETAAPILHCRVNQKFAFIETVSADMANKALNMNGIPFLGAILKISRPSKYGGPVMTGTKTWQELTGQRLPVHAFMDMSAEEKINRELFIGNTTPEMTEAMIREFLGNAMIQVGLNTMPGNPITACRVSGKFAFIELRTRKEAASALNLNNIPYLGAQLRVGRPSKWNGPPDQHGNWEDILAKYMAGELQLPSAAANNAPEQQQQQQQQQQPIATRVVELKSMLTMDDLQDENEYQDILEDTTEECSQFGSLLNVIIPKPGQVGVTKIFLEYATLEEAAKAIQGLAGRTFDGRRVEATYFEEERFQRKDYA